MRSTPQGGSSPLKASNTARPSSPSESVSSAVPAGNAQMAMTVSYTRLPSPSSDGPFREALLALGQDWQNLAKRATTSFFTSWSWIGTWLASLPPESKIKLLRAQVGPQTVGLAVLVRRGWRRLAGLPIAPTWYLHATGRQAFDTLYIEHNGFLVDDRFSGHAEAAMLQHWWQATATHGVRELWLPGIAGEGWPSAWSDALSAGGRSIERELRTRNSYSVRLDAVRKAGLDHLSTCSAGVRSHIRRSMKAYAEVGPLTLTVAQTREEALLYLEHLIELHQTRWEARAMPGSFASAWFTRFHRRLVAEQAPLGRVQLLRLHAGEHDVAYLYNFVHDGRVYFYQSGLNFDVGGKHARPGYVAHLLAIELNARLGHQYYDFMDGDDRYKRDLATTNERMSDLILRTPALRFRLERRLRQWHARRRAAALLPALEGQAASPAAGPSG